MPVLVIVQDEMIGQYSADSKSSYIFIYTGLLSVPLTERNANGKVVKADLRKRVRKEWARRLELRNNSKGNARTKL